MAEFVDKTTRQIAVRQANDEGWQTTIADVTRRRTELQKHTPFDPEQTSNKLMDKSNFSSFQIARLNSANFFIKLLILFNAAVTKLK